MRHAHLDPQLRVDVVSARPLIYTEPAPLGEDRPPHVRAASGLANLWGRLAVIQDDAAFIALVGDGVAAIALPRGADGRRRFEAALGNKAEKLDLEACLVVDGTLWAFGSGGTPLREKIVQLADTPHLHDASPLYARLREALGGAVNLEGVAAAGKELWLFHRGNTGPVDPGPAVVRIVRADLVQWLASLHPCPEVQAVDRYDLGTTGGVRLGFTDAVAVRDHVYYLAAAEASPDAVADGAVLGSQLGVIAGERVRAAPLAWNGSPIKAEGLAFDAADPRHAFVTIDPDDVDQPAQLLELRLAGPW